MIASITKRAGQTVVLMIVMSLIVFFAISVIGNPVDVLISPDMGAAERDRIIRNLGLDQPIYLQYLAFVRNLLSGDFGQSFIFGQPAISLILQRMPATLELAVSALIASIVIGLPLGMWAGLHPDRLSSRLVMSLSVLGFSLPTFWIGIMMMMFFSVMLGWLPATGRGDTTSLFGIQVSFLNWDGIRHLILPAATLAILKISLVIRLARAGVREAVFQDWVKFARAKGISERRLVLVHILKNILIPVITVLGIEFGQLIAFSLVTETIYAWPGMGKLIIDSIQVLDRPVIVAYLIVVVVLISVINLATDIVYIVLDPRIRDKGAL